jgi:hypothetical protein
VHNDLAVTTARGNNRDTARVLGETVGAVLVSPERVHERLGEHAAHLGSGDGALVLARFGERMQVLCEVARLRVRS